MTFAVTMDVAEPVELYDAVHRALLERTGGVVDGLLVHLARQTGDGFRWSRCGSRARTSSATARRSSGRWPPRCCRGGRAVPRWSRRSTSRGLVLPRAGVAV